MSPPDWFSPSYEIARRRFREAAAAIGAVAERYAVETGGQDTNLTIDVVTVGSAAPRGVVIVSSGLHGVEGFFGSAIQLSWLARLVGGAAPPADGAVVLVHGLNPYGFARLRRTDAGNVDLNRNFLDTDEAYDGAPARYAALDRFLNPTSPPSRAEPFTLKALWYIRRFGLPALKEAVAGGQYLFPRGLFFGGRGPAPSAQIVRRHLATWVGSAPRVLHLDLHSGLGAHGGHRLLLLESADAPDVEWYRDTFGRDVVEPAAGGARTAYAASGTLGGWAQRHLRGTRYRFVNAEFGTYSIVRVLGALRAENRAHFFGRPGTASYRQAKTELLECFCPRSHRWREQVVKAGLALLDRAVEAQTP